MRRLGQDVLQLTGYLIHADEMKRSIDKGTEEVDDSRDECSLVNYVLCLPLVRPRKGDIERSRLVVGSERRERQRGRNARRRPVCL